jgi:hypothetical protein
MVARRILERWSCCAWLGKMVQAGFAIMEHRSEQNRLFALEDKSK